jgi:ketosteroid isomerase-like protein
MYMGFSGRVWPVIAALLFLTGCDGGLDSSLSAPAIDLEQERENLRQQDLRFAEAAYKDGVAKAYRRFMAEDAIQLPDGGLAIGGRDEIYAELSAITADSDFSLTWEPLEVEVAASGELGFTWGIYYFESLDELGAPYVAEGKYVYLWRKNAGRWELILDITNQSPTEYEELVEGEAANAISETEAAEVQIGIQAEDPVC